MLIVHLVLLFIYWIRFSEYCKVCTKEDCYDLIVIKILSSANLLRLLLVDIASFVWFQLVPSRVMHSLFLSIVSLTTSMMKRCAKASAIGKWPHKMLAARKECTAKVLECCSTVDWVFSAVWSMSAAQMPVSDPLLQPSFSFFLGSFFFFSFQVWLIMWTIFYDWG